MCLDTFLKVSKGNNLISKSRAFHNVGAAYTKKVTVCTASGRYDTLFLVDIIQLVLLLLDMMQLALHPLWMQYQCAFISSNTSHPEGMHGFVLHLIVDAVAVQPSAFCIYLDLQVVDVDPTPPTIMVEGSDIHF